MIKSKYCTIELTKVYYRKIKKSIVNIFYKFIQTSTQLHLHIISKTMEHDAPDKTASESFIFICMDAR